MNFKKNDTHQHVTNKHIFTQGDKKKIKANNVWNIVFVILFNAKGRT